jgi:hypothetical protein
MQEEQRKDTVLKLHRQVPSNETDSFELERAAGRR